jgi:hypothetical protein
MAEHIHEPEPDEIARLRDQITLLRAEVAGYAAQMMDLQRDCIAGVQRERRLALTLEPFAQFFASLTPAERDQPTALFIRGDDEALPINDLWASDFAEAAKVYREHWDQPDTEAQP